MVARWQYRSTPPRCLHPMFDSKQCQRCGATAKAGWDFGGGSRQPAAGNEQRAASLRSCEAQADPERSRSIVGSAAATKRASPRMQTNNPTRYTRVSTPSYRIGTFLHVEHCESCSAGLAWHGERYVTSFVHLASPTSFST
ncbi:PREDICTED: uncharacterized protein LOC105152142 [Acromyrmex echinatior]|uniref:uncharacterized protein LOC105152142 n=1 Tax=Acromyrmex echinatior TaxID=103372 RepID=UPI0005810D1C|nr:PREDICTED: uncharacterized protein LOC105152142 [Acromyrmex echinatior]